MFFLELQRGANFINNGLSGVNVSLYLRLKDIYFGSITHFISATTTQIIFLLFLLGKLHELVYYSQPELFGNFIFDGERDTRGTLRLRQGLSTRHPFIGNGLQRAQRTQDLSDPTGNSRHEGYQCGDENGPPHIAIW